MQLFTEYQSKMWCLSQIETFWFQIGYSVLLNLIKLYNALFFLIINEDV